MYEFLHENLLRFEMLIDKARQFGLISFQNGHAFGQQFQGACQLIDELRGVPKSFYLQGERHIHRIDDRCERPGYFLGQRFEIFGVIIAQAFLNFAENDGVRDGCFARPIMGGH